MLLKCCTHCASKFGKLSSGHRTGKCHFYFNPKKDNAKECSNYHTIALIPHTSKVMLKSSKPGFNITSAENFQMFKLGFKESEEPEIKLSRLIETRRKQGCSRKTSTSVSLTLPKPLTVWITTNCGKF